MILKRMDSLDLVAVVILIEEFFGPDMTSNVTASLSGLKEMVDWLEPHLSNRRPNKQAAAFLKKLAKDHRFCPYMGQRTLVGKHQTSPTPIIDPSKFRLSDDRSQTAF